MSLNRYLSTSLPFKHPSTLPLVSGLYVRDWRGTDILPERERVLSVDFWLYVPNSPDRLFPGEWFVFPEGNDASRQRLPWRELTQSERMAFELANPDAMRIVAELLEVEV